MFRRTLLAAPLLALVAHGAPVKLDTLPAYREGLDAMSSHLWDIAGARFETALQSPDLDPAGKKAVLFRIAEAKIRAGDFPGAEKTLADPLLKDDPDLTFWKAQTFAGLGRLKEAAELLDEKTTAPNAPHRAEAIFTRAAIQQSLGNFRDALATLAPLVTDPATMETARLRSAALLLSLDQPADALGMLPPEKGMKGAQHVAEAKLLRGRALLARHESKAAAALFSSVLEQNDDPASRMQHQDAAIGLAQARLEAGAREDAADVLLAFLRDKEDSTTKVGPVFEQLFLCLPPGEFTLGDKILTALKGWVPPAAPLPMPPPAPLPALGRIPDLFNPASAGAVTVWPTPSPALGEFSLNAIFFRALGLRREGSPDALGDARQLLNRLRIEYPKHPLALRAVWETAIWDLADGKEAQAGLALEGLQRITADRPEEEWLKVAAQITEAHEQFAAKNFTAAAATLQEASAGLNGPARRLTRENAASALLAAGDLPAFDALAKTGGQDRLEADLALERALYLTSRRDPEGIKALDRFILANPDHPRLAEARLASAHAALEAPVPDLALAKAQLESIPPGSAVSPGSLILARIRIATRSGNWKDAVDLAEEFLKANPNDPRKGEVTFELGNAHFQQADYNPAQLVFQGLAADHPDSPLAQLAQFWAARSAALGATPQAKEQSVELFDKVVAGKGPLSDLARLYKADAQIDLGKLSEAIAGLEPWVKAMKKDDPLRINAGLQLAEALNASGSADKRDRALALYNELLASLPPDSPRRFELKYRIGLALENKEEDGKAFETYYSVLALDRSAWSQVTDWQWIDKCGVGARRLLEEAHKWDSAIGVAERHARLPSPGAKEAGDRASILRMDHMIMGD